MLTDNLDPGALFMESASHDVDAVIKNWKKIQELYPSWSLLKGARVLDLASGSYYSRSPNVQYYPHFARFCAINGAEVTAVDIVPQSDYDKMLFTAVRADIILLTRERRLFEVPKLKGKLFDIIHSSSFVGSNPAPSVQRQIGGLSGLAIFEQKLLDECAKMIADGGIIDLGLLGDGSGRLIHRMVGGKLIPETNG